MDFVANFIRFPAMQKCENRLIFDKVTESIKVGTFLRHSVYTNFGHFATSETVKKAENNRQLLERKKLSTYYTKAMHKTARNTKPQSGPSPVAL